MNEKHGMMNYLAGRIAEKAKPPDVSPGDTGENSAGENAGPQPDPDGAALATNTALPKGLPEKLPEKLPEEWQDAAIMGPALRKEAVNIRLDADVLAWFRQSGKGYQTRINKVLRTFVESRGGI